MGRSSILRLLAVLLLIGGVLAAPMLNASDRAANVALADDDADERGGNNGQDQNDDDDDSPGNGRGNDGDDDGDGNRGKEKSKAKGNEKKRERAETVAPTVAYTVEVSCEPTDDGARTTCTFTGVTPEGAKNIGHVDLPASEVCAEVAGGDYEYVDPDPNTRVTGYTSRGSEGTFTLVLEGSVSTGGHITYWVKAGGDVFPAVGPGLVCGEPAAAQDVAPTATVAAPAEPTTTAAAAPTETAATFEVTEPAAPTTGEILVVSYRCPEKPADPSSYDWFGSCEPDGTPREFALAPVEAPDEVTTAATADTGEAAFIDLAPGTYTLEQTTGHWCNAKSDNVTSAGEVVVEAGQRTTVWAFHCGEDEPPK